MSGWVTVTGPPRSIWRAEDRDDAAGGAEHVAEADADERRRRVAGRRRRATIASAIAFEAPITVRGLTALSVEIRTKRSAPGDRGGLGDDAGRDRVVADRLERVRLHQRDVLVGGGVEDDVGLEALHHLEHPVALLAVGEHRLDAAEVPLADQLAVDPEEVVLGVVEEDEEPRVDPGDLAAELGADRAAGAGDQDDPVAQVGADACRAPSRPGSRPSTSSTWTSRSCWVSWTPPRSSSKTVGRVRTRMLAVAARGDDLAADGARGGRDRDHDLVGLATVEDLAELRRSRRGP